MFLVNAVTDRNDKRLTLTLTASALYLCSEKNDRGIGRWLSIGDEPI